MTFTEYKPPSLRYMAHLVGPGWNVTGGGEPEIPGISTGTMDMALGAGQYLERMVRICTMKKPRIKINIAIKVDGLQ